MPFCICKEKQQFYKTYNKYQFMWRPVTSYIYLQKLKLTTVSWRRTSERSSKIWKTLHNVLMVFKFLSDQIQGFNHKSLN